MSKQSGFAAVEILLTLILVAIIGFTGYYVWHSQKEANSTINATNSAAQSSEGATKTDSSPGKTSASNGGKQLVFKEWGVEIPYGTEYNFTYKMLDSSNGAAGVSTDQLQAADASCSPDKFPVGGIQRMLPSDTFDDGTTASQAASAQSMPYAHIGNYYYFYTAPQADCSSSGSKTVQGMESAGMKELKALVPLAEPVK